MRQIIKLPFQHSNPSFGEDIVIAGLVRLLTVKYAHDGYVLYCEVDTDLLSELHTVNLRIFNADNITVIDGALYYLCTVRYTINVAEYGRAVQMEETEFVYADFKNPNPYDILYGEGPSLG